VAPSPCSRAATALSKQTIRAPDTDTYNRNMILCSDCIKGSLDEGIPRGKDSTIAGVPCYITQPPAEAANGCAVILATDAFGYQLINARLIADAYADAGYTCVVPDYFQGEPMNIQLLETYEAVSSQSIFGKIAKGLQLLFLVAKQPLVRTGQASAVFRGGEAQLAGPADLLRMGMQISH